MVTDHIGTEEAETSVSVAKQLGISNHRSLEEAVKAHTEQLTSENALYNRTGKIFVG